jgi:SAM-dependent methyltransferase
MSVTASEPTARPAAKPLATQTWAGRLDLFLVSFLLLFLELASIRWFSSTVVFLTFFTNLILMGCFLGMSVGLLAASRGRDYLPWFMPLTLGAVVLSWLTPLLHGLFGKVLIGVGERGSPQQVFFGTEYRANDPGQFIVPIEWVAGAFFLLVALSFVGLGQVMGRAFNTIPNRIVAYTLNVLGSLAGIVVFALMSQFRTPPVLWYGLSAALVFRFLRRWSAVQVACAIGVITLMGLISYRDGTRRVTIWSPYYKIAYNPQQKALLTNGIGHQNMTTVGEAGGAYMLPHLINRDVGRPPFDEAMIVGAGSGNDVAAALKSGVGHVDAVEIEPVLNEIGREDHPDRPYDSDRVSIQLEDGRSFVRKTDKTYDLISYAVVDSLVLHSGYSSLRLESFLFTEEAFRDIASKLKPDGVFVMYNLYRQGWIVGRLERMVEKVFSAEPIVISLPHADEITPGTSLRGRYTMLIAGKPGCKTMEAIRQKFQEQSSFWLSMRPLDNQKQNGFGPEPPKLAGVPLERWQLIAPSRVDTTGIDQLATDDWPFLYLRERTVPQLNIRGMSIIAALSLVILLAFAPVRTLRPNGQMFFLGAGFMLLETKSVVHMALLFGSTWYVNSVVFFAILVMILFSNLYVLALSPRRIWPFYALVVTALVINAYVPMGFFLNLPGAGRVVASCAVVFVPIFFAGITFATAFRDSRHPDMDLGWNIAGVILGGLCENFSLVLGFSHLTLVAAAFYILSSLLWPRVAGPVSAEPAGASA